MKTNEEKFKEISEKLERTTAEYNSFVRKNPHTKELEDEDVDTLHHLKIQRLRAEAEFRVFIRGRTTITLESGEQIKL